MPELYTIWSLLKGAGDIAGIGVLVIMVLIWKNDLKHLTKDVADLTKWFQKHMQWHLDHAGDDKK